MSAGSSLPNSQLHLQKSWKFKIKLKNSSIWENYKTSALAEAHHVSHQQAQILSAISQRRCPFLITSQGFVQDEIGNLLYLTERISGRLSELVNLTENQCLKILSAVLQGLCVLQNLYGSIGMTEQCICFNEEGKVKIWIHPSLSCIKPIKNYNKIQVSSEIPTRRQIIMWEVIFMLEKKCLNKKLISKIKDRLQKKGINSYQCMADELYLLSQDLFLNFQKPLPKEILQNRPKQSQSSYTGSKTERSDASTAYQHISDHKKFNYSRVHENSSTNPNPSTSHEDNNANKLQRYPSIANYQELKQYQDPYRSHKRYFSNLDSKNQQPSELAKKIQKKVKNQNMETPQQSLNGYYDCIRSAPMSPKKNHERHEEKQDLQKKMKQEIKLKAQIQSKRIERVDKMKKSGEKEEKKTGEKEEKKTGEDSFCLNLKPELREAEFSNQFQTFGLLQIETNSKNSERFQKNEREVPHFNKTTESKYPRADSSRNNQSIASYKYPPLRLHTDNSYPLTSRSPLGNYSHHSSKRNSSNNINANIDAQKIEKKYEQYVIGNTYREKCQYKIPYRQASSRNDAYNYLSFRRSGGQNVEPLRNGLGNFRSKEKENETPKWSQENRAKCFRI